MGTHKKMTNLVEYFFKYGLYFVAAAVVVLFSVLNHDFVSVNNLLSIFLQSASTGLCAIGLVFVLMTGGIDISIGSIMFFSATIVAYFVQQGAGIGAAFLLAVASGIAMGCINGLLVVKLHIVPFIATLATQQMIRGAALIISKQRTVFFQGNTAALLTSTKVFGFIPIIVVIFVTFVIISQIILSRTPYGRQLFAIGNNVQAAQKIGIKAERNIFLAYIICGCMAGLAGLISSVQVGAVLPTFGKGLEFIIIAATVLGGVSLFGGKGSVFPGALVGVLLIMTIENGLVFIDANPYFYQLVRGFVIFLAVMLDCVRNKGELR